MKYIERTLEKHLSEATKGFPALILTGPRRSGKTTLLQHLFPDADYVLLEDPDEIGRAKADPRGFLDERRPPTILDEIQNVPELFNYIRSRIDANPGRCGSWILTGSQEASLMKGVTESMAGRAAVFQLLPFASDESSAVSLFRGGYPEVLAKPSFADTWFRSYVQTYLERDVRAISSIRDLSTFRRFIALVAGRSGQILNKTNIAAPLGVSVPTISQWLSILEVTGQIILVPPFYENFGKRLIKSPKLYFVDSGLACHLLGIRDATSLASSPFLGSIYEGFVASEIVKHRIHRGQERGLYYFRDQQGLEIDFLIDKGNRRLLLLEAKATRTPRPTMARSLSRLVGAIHDYESSAFVIHAAKDKRAGIAALTKGVKSLGVSRLSSIL
jgi:predicted AAA+ superfamily ATPase